VSCSRTCRRPTWIDSVHSRYNSNYSHLFDVTNIVPRSAFLMPLPPIPWEQRRIIKCPCKNEHTRSRLPLEWNFPHIRNRRLLPSGRVCLYLLAFVLPSRLATHATAATGLSLNSITVRRLVADLLYKLFYNKTSSERNFTPKWIHILNFPLLRPASFSRFDGEISLSVNAFSKTRYQGRSQEFDLGGYEC